VGGPAGRRTPQIRRPANPSGARIRRRLPALLEAAAPWFDPMPNVIVSVKARSRKGIDRGSRRGAADPAKAERYRFDEVESRWARGGIGRRAGFRFQWGDPSEFESLRAQAIIGPAARGNAALDAFQPGAVRFQGCPQARRTQSGRCPGPVRGSSSAVEHRLAKARVASSNLVFRSILFPVVHNYNHEQTRRARCSPSCRPEVFAACPQRL
jgi:hypothetical protein